MRARKRRICGVFVGVTLWVCLGHPALVSAQGKALPQKKPAATNADPATVEFDKHLQAGKEAASINRWDEARQEFLKAFELKPDNIEAVARLAQTEMATGRYREAVEHLEVFLAKPVGNAADRKVAESLLAEARSKLAMVTITVDKPGAKVSVDGRVVGESPLAGPIWVDAGHRRIEAEGPGGRVRAEKDFEAGTTPTVELVLKLDKPPVVVVENKQPWRKPLMWTGIGLAGVGIGLGVGFWVAAEDQNAEAKKLGQEIQLSRKTNESLCPPIGVDSRCTDLAALEQSRDTYATARAVGLVVGGAAAVGTLVLWLTTSPKNASAVEKKEQSFLVVPSPRGIWVTGIF